MASSESKAPTTVVSWPKRLEAGDDLYSVTNLETGAVEYLVYNSARKNAMYVRDNGSWWRVTGTLVLDFDDPKYSIEFVDVDYISEYDELERKGAVGGGSVEDVAVTAAAQECPPATLDVALNLKNRKRAIDVAAYGPLNPDEPNEEFWQIKADTWSVSQDDAKKSLCSNCVFFVITTKMRDCIAQGLGDQSAAEDPWDSIGAGELGYCEAFDFKCAASRTCDAWAVGGPITDDVQFGRGK